MTPSDVKATLSFSDGSPSMDLPIYQGTIGPEVIDIRKLYAQTGKFTYDPGFLSTASCNSTITYIDGDKGELLYRGYPIEQLATQCDYLETCYLLLKGELPSAAEKVAFTQVVTHHTMVNEQMQFFLRGFRRDAHPMAIMTGLVGALSAFYHDSTDINNPVHREISAIRLIAKMPTLVSMAYKYTDRPALHLSEERPLVRRQLHAHDVRDAVRGLRAERGAGAGDGPHLHPARRPRAERLDVDGAPVRLVGNQPVRGDRRRRRLPLGARARRRQRGRAQHARGDAEGRRRREDRRVRQAGQGQELGHQADGLRAPGLQELRPARQAHARDLPRGARRARPARRSDLQAGDVAREDRPRGRVLRRPQALPERRLLFRHRAARDRHPGDACSRRSSRWRGRSAGSRS